MSKVPESVKKCVAILKGAKSDTEKFAGLFMVTKLIKGKDCDSNCKKLLFEAITFNFLKRLLLSPDVPAECPPEIYKSVAVSVLSAFCSDPQVATHPDILNNIAVLLDIVQQGDADDNLITINEAYHCLQGVANTEAGQKALAEHGAVLKLCEIYSQKSFQTDEALNVLVTLVGHFGPCAWAGNMKPFNTLVNKLAVDFEKEHSERKFKLCEILRVLVFNAPKVNGEDESWPGSVLKGLIAILTSKIGKDQRDPALKLAAQMLNTLGAEWSLQDEEKPKQFFLLLIQLASVEVRMQLEDKKLEEILKNADLIVACFNILEVCVSCIAADTVDIEQKEKQQIYTALKGAFSAIINSMLSISKQPKAKNGSKEGLRRQLLLYGMARALSAWLAHETQAMREQVYGLLPFLLDLAKESFYAYRARHVSAKVHKGGEAGENGKFDPLSEVDLLRLLLPALCHLTVEDRARQILLKEKQDEVLQECMAFHWSIVHYQKPLVPKAERLKLPKGPVPIPEHVLEEMKDSRAAMMSICNIFMNMTVLEAAMVEDSPVFASLMKFVFNNLPELKSNSDNLVLYGNMAVLGLLLLKQQAKRVKKDDFTICRYIQATIRFLWDAYTVEEGELMVSMMYKEYWMEVTELWFLGMQTLSAILPLVPWISDFAVESGWLQGILDMLKGARAGSIPANTKCAYEDLLCHLIEANKDVIKVMRDASALTMCRNHKFMELGKKIK